MAKFSNQADVLAALLTMQAGVHALARQHAGIHADTFAAGIMLALLPYLSADDREAVELPTGRGADWAEG